MSDKPSKITIGFQGGQVLTARVAPKSLEKLLGSLAAGGWHELKAEDGDVQLNLGEVVYVLTDAGAHNVGF